MQRPLAQIPKVLPRSKVVSPFSQQAPWKSSLPASLTSTNYPATDEKSQQTSPLSTRSTSTLGMLPTASVLRSFFVMSLSSRPAVLSASTAILRRCLDPRPFWLFDIERNIFLNWFLRRTFYAQFCSGSSYVENRQCIDELRNMGYTGIILEYAREVLGDMNAPAKTSTNQSRNLPITQWRDGLLETLRACNKGDFVAMKWSGMGHEAYHRLKSGQAPSPEMMHAMSAVCDAAAQAEVNLLPAAEPQDAQASVDAWTLQMAETYNKKRPGHAILYNTYQAYLKSTPDTLSSHLKLAKERDFTLGVKLVRGAYLRSESRHLIWDSKEQTDLCYDGIAEDLISPESRQNWKYLTLSRPELPALNIMIATHNSQSVRRVMKLRNAQIAKGLPIIPLTYAQLYGMADEVSCALLHGQTQSASLQMHEKPQVYKYATWGSIRDCLNYLLRRAEENEDAMYRTKETRDAMRGEIWRRTKGFIGMS